MIAVLFCLNNLHNNTRQKLALREVNFTLINKIRMLIAFFVIAIRSNIIEYGSVVQIKGVYTKNRLGLSPSNQRSNSNYYVYTSRPPYDEQWMWSIQSDDETGIIGDNLIRTPIQCNSIVTLSNIMNDVFLSAQKTKKGELHVESSLTKDGSESQWILKCPSERQFWTQTMHFQLQNLRYKCFLSTDFENKFASNKYRVDCGNSSVNSIWKVEEGIFLTNAQTYE